MSRRNSILIAKRADGIDASRLTDSRTLKKTYIKTLSAHFRCDFRQSYINVITQKAFTGCNSCKSFYDCVGSRRIEPVVSKCLPILEQLCNTSLNRIVKVIRLNMETAETLLKLVPDLKIVHLIRDPRAILNSRRRVHKANIKYISYEAKAICKDMVENTVATMKLLQQDEFKDRIATLYYEDLSKDPLSCSKRLFSFLHVPFTERVEKWIRTNMMGVNSVGHPYAVFHRDARATSQKWRTMVDLHFTSAIDRECLKLYKLLGFLSANNTAQLKKLSCKEFLCEFISAVGIVLLAICLPMRLTDSQSLKKAYTKTLSGHLNCDFRQSYINVITQKAFTGCNSCKSFYDCVGSRRIEPVVSKCLPILEQLCNSSLNRIIKVIRLNMETAQTLLKSVPDLKIVHLIRDPRGILNSRRRIYRANIKYIADEAKSICTSMLQNTLATMRLIQKGAFKDRIATLYYEDLGKDPIACSKRLFKFLHLPFTEHVEKWIKTNMMGIHTGGNPFAVSNKDSWATSQKWRRMVSLPFASAIDHECHQLYNLLGFLPANNTAQMKMLSVDLLQKNKHLNLSVI